MTSEPVEEGRLVWLTPAEVRFERSSGGVLRAELADRCHRRVTVRRAMPLSRPEQYLSVRAGDDELGLLRGLDDLAPDQRELLLAELELRYFRPVITGVVSVKDGGGSFEWDVLTDRGPAHFLSRHPLQAAIRLDAERWVLSDVNNNRYEIRDLGSLDRRSRTLLMSLLG